MKVVDVGKVLGVLNEVLQLRELGKGKIREGKTMCMRGALLTLPCPTFSALSPIALPFALSFQLLQAFLSSLNSDGPLATWTFPMLFPLLHVFAWLNPTYFADLSPLPILKEVFSDSSN